MADIDYDLLSEKLAAAIVRATATSTEAKEQAAELARTNKAFEENTKKQLAFAKGIQDVTSRSSMLHRVLTGQNKTYTDINSALADLDEEIAAQEERLRLMGNAVDGVTDSATQFDLQQKITARAEKEKQLRTANFSIAVTNATNGLIRFAADATGAALTASLQYVKGIQRGGTSVEAAAGILTTGVDIAGSAAKTLSSGAQQAGTAMMESSKSLKGRVVGASIMALGKASEFATEKITELAKGGIDILTTEIQKSIDTYNAAAGAGAIFAEGVSELRNAAHDAGISVVTMSNIIRNNADTLYTSGMNLGVATKKISSAFAVGGDDFKRSLFNLGYAAEEQGALIAESMKYMSIAGQNVRNMTGGDIAKSTQEYAFNLKAIAAITGDDAKKRMEAVRQQTANAAVQAKLMQMDPDTRAKIENDLRFVPEQLRTAMLQQMTMGTVIDRNVNIAMSSMPEFAQAFMSMSNSLGQGPEVMGRLRESMNQSMQDAAKAGTNVAFGMAQLAGVPGVATDFAAFLQNMTLDFQRGAKNVGDTAEALDSLRKMMASSSNEMQGAISNLQIQTGHLATTIEKQIGPYLGDFGNLLITVNSKMQEMINAAGDYIKSLSGKDKVAKEEGPSWGRTIARQAMGITAGLGAGALALTGGTAATIATGGAAAIPAAIGTGVAATGGYAVGLAAFDKWFNSKEGKARGGIAEGPSTGYIEKLHGVEAVVPLSGGRSIPVTIEMMKGTVDVNDRVNAPVGARFDISSMLDAYKELSLSVNSLANFSQGIQQLGNLSEISFASELISLSRFVEDSNKTFLTNLNESKDYVNNAIAAFADALTANQFAISAQETLSPAATAAADLMMVKTIENQNKLDLNLSEFKSEIKIALDEIKTATTPAAVEAPVANTMTDVSALVNQIKISNSDLKETLLVQNKLLEQNIQSVEELISVSSDTRNYSQYIAQNTL